MKNTTTNYETKKLAARQEAIDWQNAASLGNQSCTEMQTATEHFEKLGKRYGLLKEFHENGIC